LQIGILQSGVYSFARMFAWKYIMNKKTFLAGKIEI